MTGAPIPPGCDAVVMQERTQLLDGAVCFEQTPIRSGQNLLRRGAEMRAGEVVVTRGSVLHPVRLGVLASVGHNRVKVVPVPRVAIVPTGDELVEPGETPGPGQIRNSNAVMLAGLSKEAGSVAVTLPIAPDEPSRLGEILERAGSWPTWCSLPEASRPACVTWCRRRSSAGECGASSTRFASSQASPSGSGSDRRAARSLGHSSSGFPETR